MRAKSTATIAAPTTSLPFALRRQCAGCGARKTGPGDCADCARTKRSVRRFAIGASRDPFEIEADRVAERVLDAPARVAAAAESPAIRRDTGAAVAGAVAAPASVDAVLATAGRPLESGLRRDMEQRFGHDFSQVRVHDSAAAAQSARDIDANAYTAGRDIVFGANRYAPATRAGRRLIAHELTHVVQQSGAAPATLRRDPAGGGSTTFKDTPKAIGRPAQGNGVVDGVMTHIETAPATDTEPEEVISERDMRVRFDPANCAISVPFGYSFVQAAQAARAGVCDGPAPPKAVPLLPPARFNAIKRDVLDQVNAGLSGWFDVRMSGKGCPSGCTDKPLPIGIDAHEDNAAPDKTIAIVNRGGRANAGTICAPDWDASSATHEGGHQVLGLGDEYEETDQSYRATKPGWFRKERVRTDYTKMGPEQHSRFAMFHKRHFDAVRMFLQAAFPDCKAELIERKRPVLPDFRLVAGGGYAALNRTDAGFVEFGLRAGIPLDRLRRWEVVAGPQLRYLAGGAEPGAQQAFLAGARLGLEHAAGDAASGPVAGAFGEFGGGRFDARAKGATPALAGWAPYGEAGASLGYRSGLRDGSKRFEFRVEGAAGKAFGPSGAPDADPRNGHWFRLGATLEMDF